MMCRSRCHACGKLTRHKADWICKSCGTRKMSEQERYDLELHKAVAHSREVITADEITGPGTGGCNVSNIF